MEVLMHFLHLMAAAVFLGAGLFVGLAMIPAARAALGDKDRMAFLMALGPRSKVIVWSSIGIVVVTGFYRIRALFGTTLWRTSYGYWLEAKIILALAAIALAAIHDFGLGPKMTQTPPGTPEFQQLRKQIMILSQIQLVLILAVVFIGAKLRLYTW
ncbi:MAG: CopD family protein [Elusimicrobia bacterium]|nr:CopD family protein [Elusimicrobiota bacterium]